jgi:hypothetical protein
VVLLISLEPDLDCILYMHTKLFKILTPTPPSAISLLVWFPTDDRSTICRSTGGFDNLNDYLVVNVNVNVSFFSSLLLEV